MPEAGFRCRVDDDTAFLFAEYRRCRTDGGEMPFQMDRNHIVPVALRHVVNDTRPNDARIVHQNVESPEAIDRAPDDALAAFHRGDVVVIRDRLAAEPANLLDHLSGYTLIGAAAGRAAAEIIDDNLRALAREQHRIRAPDSSSRAGDNCHLPLQPLRSVGTHRRHVHILFTDFPRWAGKENAASVAGRDGELSNCRDDFVARRPGAEDGGHPLFEEARLVGRADNRTADHEWDAFAFSLAASEKVVQIVDVPP